MSEPVEDFLAHYGILGMKWGKRKKYEETRREYKARTREEQDAFYRDKLSRTINASLKKGEDILVGSRLPGDYAVTIMTGKQFVEYASKGGLLDAKTTDVFATLDKKLGKFVQNPNPNPEFKPSERK